MGNKRVEEMGGKPRKDVGKNGEKRRNKRRERGGEKE